MADVKLNSLGNVTPSAVLAKNSATQGSGTEGWVSVSDLATVVGEQTPTMSNQTWDSLLIAAAALPVGKPKQVFVSGKIGTFGSSSGQVVTLVNRNAWVDVLGTNFYVNGQVSGSSVTNKIGYTFNTTAISF